MPNITKIIWKKLAKIGAHIYPKKSKICRSMIVSWKIGERKKNIKYVYQWIMNISTFHQYCVVNWDRIHIYDLMISFACLSQRKSQTRHCIAFLFLIWVWLILWHNIRRIFIESYQSFETWCTCLQSSQNNIIISFILAHI